MDGRARLPQDARRADHPIDPILARSRLAVGPRDRNREERDAALPHFPERAFPLRVGGAGRELRVEPEERSHRGGAGPLGRGRAGRRGEDEEQKEARGPHAEL